MTTRPLTALLAAAGGAAALALTWPGAEPPPTAVNMPPRPATAPQRMPGPSLLAAGAPAETPLPEPPPDVGALSRQLQGPEAEAALPRLEALARSAPTLALPAYERLLARWALERRFPLALQALARAPLAGDDRDRLKQQLLSRWAEVAPEQAARWALATPGQADLLAPLQDRWLQQDARSATVFASMLLPGEQRQALLDESLSRWTAQDGPAARDWLRSQGLRPELDDTLARHGASDELARHAPYEALDLVARIADPARRWQAWQALAQTLSDIAPEQVAPLLAQAPGLTPVDRERLIQALH
ncbi:hypothetical protein [Pelomonas cellulosilytica]|uniref:Secreted protein n=1 Tax=Pelomonas cellulosilytica TaxID=2906762 RepID=A0ABS8XRJ4_9BURK|nr:hypothetical protein [Pelomonas sp. P8]MCE4553773.1 hypothetical protein [Pelomonas sp. P8]